MNWWSVVRGLGVVVLVSLGCSLDTDGVRELRGVDAGDGPLGFAGSGGSSLGGQGGTPGQDGGSVGGAVGGQGPVGGAGAPGAAGGTACTLDQQCSSGFCTDGFCCESRCSGACAACARQTTNEPNGLCRPVPADSDPDGDCSTDPGNLCGPTGSCNGAGACAYAPAGTLCGQGTCAGNLFQPAAACDGAGSCEVRIAEPCSGSLGCSGEGTSCLLACAGPEDCWDGTFCDPGSGRCEGPREDGAACDPSLPDGGCESGFCVDGVCCESACTGTCTACNRTRTGVRDGRCAPVRAGVDPDNECKRDDPTTCGQDGQCDGAGACRLHAEGTQCGSTCCDSGPGRGARPCTFVCRAGRCDDQSPIPEQACGGLSCCCPSTTSDGSATCTSRGACAAGICL